MGSLVISAAQTEPFKGDIEANIRDHVGYIEVAAKHKANLLIFPELSLTGYEPELAQDLAVMINDGRLDIIRTLSTRHNMTVVVGVPIKNQKGMPYIGSLAICPNGLVVYLKQYLHPGEEKYLSSGDSNCVVDVNGVPVGLAICADISNEIHAKEATDNGASVYAASVFITPGGYAKDAALLRDYSMRYRMTVIMANYSGTSGGIAAAGRSAIWNERGEVIIEAHEDGNDMIIAEKKLNEWKGGLVEFEANS